ncbi:DUF6048 family protein [Reichenbachiella carrageenanivorans]|uniref:DUF6048 family protein n=1 Tax=Reichenbachiella carrageenanivorans TaxID=2979869 RepID=A0ABY6CVT9_9BACT|nr:DUF6048 family protein [Reichenbachiella carrageenanivorans]UXX78026.1 DUF6048 family protein [Reichenbachiella carrageenanivorans]
MSNSKCISFVILLLTASLAQAQEAALAKETLVTEEMTEKKMPLFSSVAVSLDYGKLFGQFLKTESKFEFGGQLEFRNKLILVGEYGFATLNPNGAYQNTDYQSEGNYFRVGLGYKIDMSAKNNIYFSARYARAAYSDKGTIDIASASGIYDDLMESFYRRDLSAQWFEVAMSSEARLWKGLYAGFHLRLRIMDKYDEQEPLDVYSIPGYGRTFDRSIPALNLYLKYALERF